MRNLRKILLIIIIIVFLSGCNLNNNKNENKNSKKGKFYNKVYLQDKGINMFQTILPKGWTATISSQNLINSSYPFVETVYIKNSDDTASITILSQHSYVENKNYAEGANTDYYTTYLHQMNASEYSDYFMERIYKTNNFIKDIELNNDVYNGLDNLHNLRVEMGKQDAQALQAQNYGVFISVDGVNKTVAKREYQNGDEYYELFTCVSAASTTLTSSYSSILNSYSVQWYMPYVIVYKANNKSNFNKYYDDYNFVIANSDFTKDYYAMIEYTSNAIVNSVTAVYNAKLQAGLDAMNDYIDSNYSSTSSQTTNDKVMEMWDDVIKEVDAYQMEDGSTLKTSIHNDVVAQNGDEIYIGSKAGIPNGFNQLSKGY